jgi:hypothetical protein
MATEDTLTGAMCSRLWHCRTYNRSFLRQACAECGLTWQREHWFTPLHARLRLGGILVELHKLTVKTPPRGESAKTERAASS